MPNIYLESGIKKETKTAFESSGWYVMQNNEWLVKYLLEAKSCIDFSVVAALKTKFTFNYSTEWLEEKPNIFNLCYT